MHETVVGAPCGVGPAAWVSSPETHASDARELQVFRSPPGPASAKPRFRPTWPNPPFPLPRLFAAYFPSLIYSPLYPLLVLELRQDLGQVPVFSPHSEMAPITEQTVEGLKDTIAKLEARVAQLEDRVDGSKPKSLSEQMRIILMGPPGAGSPPRPFFLMAWYRSC